MAKDNTKVKRVKVKKSFEEEAKEQAAEYAKKRNKLRLMKWLVKKQEEIQALENEVATMLEDCKDGDFSGLPDLSQKEEESINVFNARIGGGITGDLTSYTAGSPQWTTTAGTAAISNIADRVVGN